MSIPLSDTSKQARALPSGTIATLIHRSNCDVIDRAQHEFVAFIDRMDVLAGRQLYRSWQEAWAAFYQTNSAYEVMLAGR